MKPKEINSNAKIRRYEKRIEFLLNKEQNYWTINEINKLKLLIEAQKVIVCLRNKRYSISSSENYKCYKCSGNGCNKCK